MGMYCQVSAAAEPDLEALSDESLPQQQREGSCTSLEKAWHGLHYLLTGEALEGDGPLAFLLSGGKQLGDDDESPVRWFTPEETGSIHQALSGVSDDTLWSRFDPIQMEQNGVYPSIWDEAEDELKEEYLGYFHALKQVVAAAAQHGLGLVVSIG